jgi:hypothetical protein
MRNFWSARTRVLCGSAAIATAIAGLDGMAAAQPLGDGSTQPAAYHGPYLTWAGKTGGPEAAPVYSPPPAQSPAAEFASWPAPPPAAAPRPHPAPAQYVAPAQSAAPTYFGPVPHPPRAVKAYVAPAPKPRPTAVAAYVAPPAPTVHKRPPAQLAVKTPPAAPVQAPPPQQLAQNDTPEAPAAAPAASAPTTAHYYSLHREYGLTPDAVVTPTERPMVLIGPPDGSSAQKQDNPDGDAGSDKPGDQEGADN